MPIPSLDELNEILERSGARWRAVSNPIIALSDSDRRRRLGVTIDRGALAELARRTDGSHCKPSAAVDEARIIISGRLMSR